MSHTTTIETKITDRDALVVACSQLGLTLTEGKTELFDGTTIDGLAVTLKGWRYPVVIDSTGKAHYDNYGGHWGKQAELDELMQTYACAVTRRQLARQGFRVTERRVNGKIVLTASR